MDDLPATQQDMPSGPDELSPAGLIARYLELEDEREKQKAIVDEFVERYFGLVREIADDFMQRAPARIPTASAYRCTPDRGRCVFTLRFAHVVFQFVHIRDVAYSTFAPVPDDIAGLLALYVQDGSHPEGPPPEGFLVSTCMIYPLRREWRFMWGHSAGRLYGFDDMAVLREKILRELRGVLTGGNVGGRRWPDPDQLARVPGEMLVLGEDESPTIGFLKPSLRMQRPMGSASGGAAQGRAAEGGENA